MINFRSSNLKYNYVWHYVVTIIVSFILGFLFDRLFISWKSNITHNINEVRIVNTTQNDLKSVKIDSLAIFKLQNSIDLISQKNDGRFEVLGWGAALLISIFVAFLTFNAIVSTGKVRELVDSEIEKKSESIEKMLNDKLEKYQNLDSKAEEQLNKLNNYVSAINTQDNE